MPNSMSRRAISACVEVKESISANASKLSKTQKAPENKKNGAGTDPGSSSTEFSSFGIISNYTEAADCYIYEVLLLDSFLGHVQKMKRTPQTSSLLDELIARLQEKNVSAVASTDLLFDGSPGLRFIQNPNNPWTELCCKVLLVPRVTTGLLEQYNKELKLQPNVSKEKVGLAEELTKCTNLNLAIENPKYKEIRDDPLLVRIKHISNYPDDFLYEVMDKEKALENILQAVKELKDKRDERRIILSHFLQVRLSEEDPFLSSTQGIMLINNPKKTKENLTTQTTISTTSSVSAPPPIKKAAKIEVPATRILEDVVREEDRKMLTFVYDRLKRIAPTDPQTSLVQSIVKLFNENNGWNVETRRSFTYLGLNFEILHDIMMDYRYRFSPLLMGSKDVIFFTMEEGPAVEQCYIYKVEDREKFCRYLQETQSKLAKKIYIQSEECLFKNNLDIIICDLLMNKLEAIAVRIPRFENAPGLILTRTPKELCKKYTDRTIVVLPKHVDKQIFERFCTISTTLKTLPQTEERRKQLRDIEEAVQAYKTGQPKWRETYLPIFADEGLATMRYEQLFSKYFVYTIVDRELASRWLKKSIEDLEKVPCLFETQYWTIAFYESILDDIYRQHDEIIVKKEIKEFNRENGLRLLNPPSQHNKSVPDSSSTSSTAPAMAPRTDGKQVAASASRKEAPQQRKVVSSDLIVLQENDWEAVADCFVYVILEKKRFCQYLLESCCSVEAGSETARYKITVDDIIVQLENKKIRNIAAPSSRFHHVPGVIFVQAPQKSSTKYPAHSIILFPDAEGVESYDLPELLNLILQKLNSLPKTAERRNKALKLGDCIEMLEEEDPLWENTCDALWVDRELTLLKYEIIYPTEFVYVIDNFEMVLRSLKEAMKRNSASEVLKFALKQAEAGHKLVLFDHEVPLLNDMKGLKLVQRPAKQNELPNQQGPSAQSNTVSQNQKKESDATKVVSETDETSKESVFHFSSQEEKRAPATESAPPPSAIQQTKSSGENNLNGHGQPESKTKNQLRKEKREQLARLAEKAALKAQAFKINEVSSTSEQHQDEARQENKPLPDPINCAACSVKIQPVAEEYYHYTCGWDLEKPVCSFHFHKECLNKKATKKQLKTMPCPTENCGNNTLGVWTVGKDHNETLYIKADALKSNINKIEADLKSHEKKATKQDRKQEKKKHHKGTSDENSKETSMTASPFRTPESEQPEEIAPSPVPVEVPIFVEPEPVIIPPCSSSKPSSSASTLPESTTTIPMRKRIEEGKIVHLERKKDDTEEKYGVEKAQNYKIRDKKQRNKVTFPVRSMRGFNEEEPPQPVRSQPAQIEVDFPYVIAGKVSNPYPGTTESCSFQQNLLSAIESIIEDLPINLPVYEPGVTLSVGSLFHSLLLVGQGMLDEPQQKYLKELLTLPPSNGEQLKKFVHALRYYNIGYVEHSWKYQLSLNGRAHQEKLRENLGMGQRSRSTSGADQRERQTVQILVKQSSPTASAIVQRMAKEEAQKKERIRKLLQAEEKDLHLITSNIDHVEIVIRELRKIPTLKDLLKDFEENRDRWAQLAEIKSSNVEKLQHGDEAIYPSLPCPTLSVRAQTFFNEAETASEFRIVEKSTMTLTPVKKELLKLAKKSNSPMPSDEKIRCELMREIQRQNETFDLLMAVRCIAYNCGISIFQVPAPPFSKQQNNEHLGNRVDEGHENECPICLEGMEDEQRLVKCEHCPTFFHYKCIKVWHDANSSCPTCRGFFILEAMYPPLR